jgi:hypothetical protein
MEDYEIMVYRLDEDYAATLQDFYEALKKPSKVYGDILDLFVMKMSDLPAEYSENVIRIYTLYRDLVNFKANALADFVDSVLFHAGYREGDFFEGDDEEVDDRIKAELSKNSARDFNADPINFEDYGSLLPYHVNNFMSLSEPFNSVNVSLFAVWPGIDDKKAVFPIYEVDSIIDSLKRNQEDTSEAEGMNFLIIDPILNRLFREKVQTMKKKVEGKLKSWKVLSPEEFMEYFISNEHDDFLDSHQMAINGGKQKLEQKYPFLALRKQLKRISKARRDIQIAVHDSSVEALNDKEIEDIMRRVLNGIEGLLLAFYGHGPAEDSRPLTFRDILNEHKQELLEDYGEDVFKELIYLNEMRNNVSHPNGLHFGNMEMKKVVGRADLFLDLIEIKFGKAQRSIP